MPIQFNCTSCSKKLSVGDQFSGRTVKCPSCGNQASVPIIGPTGVPSQPAAAPRPQAKSSTKATTSSSASAPSNAGGTLIKCPCGTTLKVSATNAAQTVKCPKCDRQLRTGASSAATARSPAPVPPVVDSSTGGLFDDLPPIAPVNYSSPASHSSGGGGGGGSNSSDFWTTPPAPPRSNSSSANPWLPDASERRATTMMQFDEASNHRKRGFGGTISWDSRLTWFIIAMILIGPILGLVGLNERRKELALAKDGVTVPGEIMEGEWRRGRRSRTFKLTVAYTPEGGAMRTHTFSVGSTKFYQHCTDDAIVNDVVQVIYSKSDPSILRLVGDSSMDSTFFIGLGVFLFIAGLIAFAVIYFKGDD